MKKSLNVRAIIAAIFLFLIIPSEIHAVEFKIKPVVVSGAVAPDGKVLLDIESPVLNRRGDAVFSGRVSFEGAIFNLYLIREGSISLLAEAGKYPISGRIPDPESLGLTQVPCPFKPRDCTSFESRSTQFYETPDGGIITCTGLVDLPGASGINDSLDRVSQGRLVTGGAIISYRCPTFEGLNRFLALGSRVLEDSTFIGIANSGALAHRVGYKRFSTDATHHDMILLFKGEDLSIINLMGAPAPGGGIIRGLGNGAMNENETFLIPFFSSFRLITGQRPDGLLLFKSGQIIPVTWKGMPAPGGGIFQSFSGWVVRSVGLNDAEQIVFTARLDNGTEAIFRRDPDGTIIVLATIVDFFPTTLSINQNGDIVALNRFSSSSSKIIYFDSAGDSTRIVGSGDPTPEGATFQVFGHPEINNKGEVIFWARLSDGRTGIFLASAGLETEFVDLVPDLLAGPDIITDPGVLGKEGRKVTGIAADGTAQVVARVKTGQAGTVELSLVDAAGASLPPNNFTGSLSQVGESIGSSTVSVSTVDVEGVGPMAFVAYHAPMDFASGPNSSEATLKEDEIFIKVKFQALGGETVESTERLRIVRPPVVLVHGLWGDRSAWDRFAPRMDSVKFFVERINYRATNASPFAVNAPRVAEEIKFLIKEFRATEHVAAIQADVVTHSMGGLLARSLPLLEDDYFREDNFGLGDIHKLINIDSPHLGSPLASFLRRSPCVGQFLSRHGSPTDQGAVEDLIPNSQALNRINSMVSPLQLHQIVGLAHEEDKNATEFSPAMLWLRLIGCRHDFRGFPSSGFFDAVLGTPDHDLIVPASSQRGHATGNFTTVPDVIHSRVPFFFAGIGVLESSDVAQRVIQLLNTPLNQPDFAP